MKRLLELRRLRHEYALLKAENDKVFWTIHNDLPQCPWKSRIRRTIEICRVGEEFQREKALWRRIRELEGA